MRSSTTIIHFHLFRDFECVSFLPWLHKVDIIRITHESRLAASRLAVEVNNEDDCETNADVALSYILCVASFNDLLTMVFPRHHEKILGTKRLFQIDFAQLLFTAL
jgi:hypothetical protein